MRPIRLFNLTKSHFVDTGITGEVHRRGRPVFHRVRQRDGLERGSQRQDRAVPRRPEQGEFADTGEGG